MQFSSFLAFAITLILALTWLRLWDYFAQRGWIDSGLSRKIIHIGTGPLFVLCWLLFPEVPAARYLAALIPLAITAQFFLVGAGLVRDEAAVQAMSRTGDRREILRGPLLYGIIFVVITLLYWRESPVGVTALMLMCGGDGLADIAGRRLGQVKLPWNPLKSWVGTLGMILGGWVLSAVILAIYVNAGVFPGPVSGYLTFLTLVVLAGSFVETLPIKDIDNLTVTLTALGVGHLLV